MFPIMINVFVVPAVLKFVPADHTRDETNWQYSHFYYSHFTIPFGGCWFSIVAHFLFILGPIFGRLAGLLVDYSFLWHSLYSAFASVGTSGINFARNSD